MPAAAMQHGPVRNVQWALDAVNADTAEQVCITLSPSRRMPTPNILRQWAPHLRVSLRITLDESLVQTLETHNHGPHTFALTQALHNYFAVQDATQVRLHGLTDLCFEDKVAATSGTVQHGVFHLGTACDRVYQQHAPGLSHHYTLEDSMAQRRLHIHTQGSQSVVVWNPGAERSLAMADVPDGAWRHFLCVEASNAGQDTVLLAPGGRHRLTQSLTAERYTVPIPPGP